MAWEAKNVSFGYVCTGGTSGTITTDKVQVKALTFCPVNAANDGVQLQDTAGNQVWRMIGPTQYKTESIVFIKPIFVDGLKVPTSGITNAADILTVFTA